MPFAEQEVIDRTGSGTIVANGGTVIAGTAGSSDVSFNLTGTWVATLVVEASPDATNWLSVLGITPSTEISSSSYTSNTFFVVPCGGYQLVRIRATAYTSGTVAVAFDAGAGVNYVSQGLASDTAWTVNQTEVGGVSITLGSKTSANSYPVVIASDQATIPISAASLPLPTGASTSALQTTGNTSLASIDTKTPALGQTTMSASQPVVIASNQSAVPVSQSGTWTVQPGNTANTTPWLATINQGGNSATVTASNALKVDGSAVTQTISGTVTANAGTNLNTSALALDTSVNGVLVAQGSTTSGEKGPLIQAAVTTAAPSYSTAQTSPLSLTTAGALRMDGSAVTQPVSGTVTANQGTSPWVVNESQVGGSNITLGQKTSANSYPVVLSSDQSVLTIASVPTDGTKATYSASIVGLTVATLATDIFTITGSGTKTIRITRIAASGSTTAGSGLDVNLNLIIRSAADTGGTSTTCTNVPHDSNSAAGTAIVKAYTVNPASLGAAVGPVRTARFSFTTTGAAQLPVVWEFGNRPSQCIVLRGTSQQAAVAIGGITIAGGVADIDIEWTEE